ncbi:MAG TPA: hypothetical protein VEI97_15685, partial [bacterium]|nr:hypothetical protein [bacterium]
STTTTALVVNNDPEFITNYTDANSSQFVQDQVYATSGTVPVPNPNGVSAYAPSTGTLTPSITYTTKPDNTASFLLIKRGVSYGLLKQSVNAALRKLSYSARWPLTLVVDGDMETSGTGSWTTTAFATATKVTNTNAREGSQSLRVVVSGGAGYAQSEEILTDPQIYTSWYVRARLRAVSGTMYVKARDTDNNQDIESATWDGEGWGVVEFTFTPTAAAEGFRILFGSDDSSAEGYLDEVIAYPLGLRTIPLPSWVTSRDQVRRLVYGETGHQRDDLGAVWGYPHWSVREDTANPNSAFSLTVDPALHGPAYLEAWRPFSELTTDSSSTTCDRELLEQAAKVELLERLQNRAPAQETDAWRNEYQKHRRKLKALIARRYPKSLHLGFRDPY